MSMTHQFGERESPQHVSTKQAPLPKPASEPRRSARQTTAAPASSGIGQWVFGGIPSFSTTDSSVTETRIERYDLSARIRIPEAEHDSDDGEPATPSMPATNDAPASPAGPTDLADGETAELPIYVSSYPADPDLDAISATLSYSPSVAISPDEPADKTDFGTTWGNHVRTAKGGKIHRAGSTFEVSQTFENPIVIRVFNDTGPRSQVNIESETDSDIKAGNFAKVASDLTPGTDNRPPRGQFWARDLTLIHEQFHATDGQKFCKDAVADEQKTLNTKTASTMDEVKVLLHPIVDRIVAARGAGMVKPASEDRAYADGAAAYKARAAKIAAQGKAGKYTASIEPSPSPDDSGAALAGEPAPAAPGASETA